MQALLKIAASGLVTAVMLTSCSSANSASQPTTAVPAPSASAASQVPSAPAEAPAAPDPADDQAATAGPSPTPPSGSADAKEDGEANKSADLWGRYGDQADACAAVAANVASLLLVPLSFMT